jgi:three-Cys-motif partner protein
MGDLVSGDDGLPAEEVGEWVVAKHKLLCDYIQISSTTRKKYITPPRNGGAAYIDLFCGPGRAKVRGTGAFVDGGSVAAWRKSVESGSPFSRVIIGDTDRERLEAAKARLVWLNAPVVALLGTARDNASSAWQLTPKYGLNFAFLDPFNLGSLDFNIIATLSRLQRIDMLVHVSQMDLQRNFDRNAMLADSALDAFAPGWRDGVDLNQGQRAVRQAYFNFWKEQVDRLGVAASTDIRLITGPGNQPLYLLLLAARHELAHKFWQIVAKQDKGQGSFDF